MPELFEFPLVAGVDQHFDARKLPPTHLTRAENVVYTKAGRLDKRDGFSNVTSTLVDNSSMTSPANLHARGSELISAESGRLLVRSTLQDRFINQDKLPEWTARKTQAATTNGAASNASVASAGPTVCIVWWSANGAGSGGSILAEIRDVATGTILHGPQVIGNNANQYAPKVVLAGSVFVATWHDGAGTITAATMDSAAATLTWSASSAIRADGRVSPDMAYDICRLVGSNDWLMAYQNNAAGAARLSLYRFDNALATVASSTSGAIAVNYESVAVIGTNAPFAQVTVGYTLISGGNDIVVASMHNTAMAVTVGPTNVVSTATSAGFQKLTLVYNSSGSEIQAAWKQWNAIAPTWGVGGVDWMMKAVNFTAAGLALTGTAKILHHATPASKLFLSGSTSYMLVEMQPHSLFYNAGDAVYKDVYLVHMQVDDTSSAAQIPRPVCSIEPRVGLSSSESSTCLSEVVVGVTTEWLTVYAIAGQLIYAASATTRPNDLMLATFYPDEGDRMSANLGGLLYLSGGVPSWYDGRRVGEVGFTSVPGFDYVASNGAGALTVNSVYRYAIVWEQTDNAGNIHRSAPLIRNVTLGAADDTVAISVAHDALTTRQDIALGVGMPVIRIYRSVANGTVLRQVSGLIDYQSAVAASSTGTMRNEPATFGLVYTDLAPDGDLANKPFLYTTVGPDGNGALDNVNPPSAKYVVAHRNRIWLAGCPDRKEIWISKKLTVGEAPGFNEGLVQYVDVGGDITAIASLDDKLIVFKSDMIFYITGDGPDDAGNSNDWSDPIRIQSPVGCIEQRSVCVTPIGVAFLSRTGFSLMTRSLDVVPEFGSPVEDIVASYPNCAYSYVHETRQEIRFGMYSASYAAGIELRYDYRAKTWYSATLIGGAAMRGAVTIGGTAYVQKAASPCSIYAESNSSWLDAGAFVNSTIEFGNFPPGAVQGYNDIHHVVLQMDRHTDHALNVEASFDGGSYTSIATVNAAASGALSRYQVDAKPVGQTKCQSFRLRISDSYVNTTLGNGRSFSLASVAIEYTPTGTRQKSLAAAAKR